MPLALTNKDRLLPLCKKLFLSEEKSDNKEDKENNKEAQNMISKDLREKQPNNNKLLYCSICFKKFDGELESGNIKCLNCGVIGLPDISQKFCENISDNPPNLKSNMFMKDFILQKQIF